MPAADRCFVSHPEHSCKATNSHGIALQSLEDLLWMSKTQPLAFPTASLAQHISAAYVQWIRIAESFPSCKKAAEASKGSGRQMGFQNNADQKHGAQPRRAAYRYNDLIALLLLDLSLIVHCSEKYGSRSRPREMRV